MFNPPAMLYRPLLMLFRCSPFGGLSWSLSVSHSSANIAQTILHSPFASILDPLHSRHSTKASCICLSSPIAWHHLYSPLSHAYIGI
jgi:hypothetical protein